LRKEAAVSRESRTVTATAILFFKPGTETETVVGPSATGVTMPDFVTAAVWGRADLKRAEAVRSR
jgi:hypothetical protein